MEHPIELSCPKCNGRFFISGISIGVEMPIVPRKHPLFYSSLVVAGFCNVCKDGTKTQSLSWNAELTVLVEKGLQLEMDKQYNGQAKKFFALYEKQMQSEEVDGA